MLDIVYYLHWFLMALVGVAGLSILHRPHTIARIYIVGFLAQQLILDGCIMTAWENKVKIGMGLEPRENEFIMAHVLNGQAVSIFKILFLVVILMQIIEMFLELSEKGGRRRRVAI